MKAEDLSPILKTMCDLMSFQIDRYENERQVYDEVIREIGILQGQADLANKMAEHQTPLDLRTLADDPSHFPATPGDTMVKDGTGNPPPGMVEPSTTKALNEFCVHPGILTGQYCPNCDGTAQ